MARPPHRRARSLLITADAGASNGARFWKWEPQRLANRTGLAITVCHIPPGTSKRKKIEHRLFSYIAMNWRGTPLVNLATIVSLIGATRSRSGLRIRSELDRGRYPSGVAVTDAQLAAVRLERHPRRLELYASPQPHPTTSSTCFLTAPCCAPVNAPRSYPKSSDSSNCSVTRCSLTPRTARPSAMTTGE